MAKEIQLSPDNGVNWFTLPGGSGTISFEGEELNDTIFGQTFQSSQTGLITWSVSGNAIFKGFAGYLAKVKKQGISTIMVGDPMAQVGATQTWKISDPAKEIWDRSSSFTVLDGVTDVTANVESFNYLFGEVTFASGFTPAGSVTVDGSFFPTTDITKAQSYTLTQTASTIDKTDFATAQMNGGYRVFSPGLRTVSLELSGFFDSSQNLLTELLNRNELVIEINPDGSGNSLARGFFKMLSKSQSGDVGALEQETLNFGLSVPENVTRVFAWQHAPLTTLSNAVRTALDSWEQQSIIDVRYLPDGVGTGNVAFSGDFVITDVSLTGGLDGLNEFTVNGQGSGLVTRTVFP